MALPIEIRVAYLKATADLRAGKKVRFAKPLTGLCVVATMTEIIGTETPNNSPKFKAVAEVDGQRFEAESRRGASCALARLLKEAGIEDQPLSVRSEDGRELFRWPSLYRCAELTYAESEKTSARSGKYVDVSARLGTT